MVNVKKVMSPFYRFRMRSDRRLALPGCDLSPSRSASRGMTLVELLAASVLLSIIIGFVLMLYSQSWAASVKDNEHLTATHIAQFTLEEWMARHDYLTVKDKMNDSRLLTRENDAVLQEIWAANTGYQSYTPRIELAYADPARNVGPIRVTITVVSNNKRTVTLHGIMSESKPEKND